MATTTTHIPVEDYLRSSYEPDAEYVDGQIEERPMGEREHALWQKAILLWFWQHEKQWNVEVLPEQRVQVASSRYRVPDAVILDLSEPKERIVTRAPIAIFEILSPEDTLQRLKQRLEDYFLMGIPEIWVIDPQDNTYYRYEDLQLIRKQTFVHAAKNITFDMKEIENLLG